jgi:hypothetical protein
VTFKNIMQNRYEHTGCTKPLHKIYFRNVSLYSIHLIKPHELKWDSGKRALFTRRVFYRRAIIARQRIMSDADV